MTSSMNSFTLIKSFRNILDHFLKMRLSDEEVDLLKSAIAGYYGNSAGGNFDKNIFTNFMSKSKP